MKKGGVLLSVCSLCLFCFLLAAGPLHAIDLTLNISVELVNIPKSITDGSIQCQARQANRNTGVTGGPVLGEGNAQFAINGSFNSAVTIVIRNQGENPASGIGWLCALYLLDSSQRKDAGGWQLAGTVMARYLADTTKLVRFEVKGHR